VSRGERFFDVVDTAPLLHGDLIVVRCLIPAGLHAALLSLNGEGKATVLERLPPADEPRELRFPAGQDEAAPLTGPPGGELLLACVSRKGPIDDDALARPEFTAAWRNLRFRSVFSFDPTEVRVESESRDFGTARVQSDPEGEARRLLEELRYRLTTTTDGFAGLAFPHLDAE
jgi:hypothetical protein